MSQTYRIAGYASLFNVRDGAGDRIRQGAFLASLRQRPAGRVAMLWQHDPTRPIGRWTRLLETKRGLWAEGQLTCGVGKAREAAHLLASGGVSGLSIGFKAQKARRETRASGRLLEQIDLWEISLVTFPQVEDARAQLVLPQ